MSEERNPRGQPPEPSLDGSMKNMRRMRVLIWVMLLAALTIWLLRGTTDEEPISYTRFRQAVIEDQVDEVTVQGDRITGELAAAGGEGEPEAFVTYVPSFGDEALMELLEQQDVEIVTRPPTDMTWSLILISALPLLAIVWLGFMFARRFRSQGQQLFNMNRSGARRYERSASRTTFDDVAGADGAKQELREIIEFLKDPDFFRRLGGKPPKGILLVGPPGTGKTLLARAVAGEAGVPFLSITGSDFMEMFVGVGASRVRDLFRDARRSAPCIIFIDELDSIGRRRGAGLGGGHDEREQTLNQMLSEMDGFEANQGVIVMAATNRPDILDPALLRPGRFDRRVLVSAPTAEARRQILEIHGRDKPLGDDVDLGAVARGTPGFSGADLKNLLNEAALLAARDRKDRVENADIDRARDKIMLGLEREGMVLSEEERRLVSYHEAGHALVAASLPGADPIAKVSIVPRDHSMGVTQQLPERERYLYPRELLLDRLAVVLGGRAAEKLVYDSATTGAGDDLKQASRLARRMVLDWGMSERIGLLTLTEGRDQVFLGEELSRPRELSEQTAREADEEVRGLLDQAYQRALALLTEKRETLDRIAEHLVEREEIDGRAITELLAERGHTPTS
jgi:cell division protease FtsH